MMSTAKKVPPKAVQEEMAEGLAGSAWKLQCCPICVWSLSPTQDKCTHTQQDNSQGRFTSSEGRNKVSSCLAEMREIITEERTENTLPEITFL